MMNNELCNYLREFKKGNKEVFENIYNLTNNQLFNVIYNFTKDKELSYDLMQETYITFYTKAESINNAESIKKWLIVVAINKAKRYLQTKNRDILVTEQHDDIFENQEELNKEFLPQEILDCKEKQKIIKDIIDNLSLEQKTSVYLYYFNEMSLSEVAEEMGCSEGTVKSRLNYARKKIKVEVDSWEKRGTKLYSTGIPVLVLLLKSQMQDANAMSLDRAKDILNNIKNFNTGTSSISNMKNIYKGLSNKIITSCVAGGLAILLIAGYQVIKRKNNIVSQSNQATAIQTNNEDDSNKIQNTDKTNLSENKDIKRVYIAYDELGISNTVNINSSNNYVQVKDLPNDRCIEILNNGGLTNKEDTLYIAGKQIDIILEYDGGISDGHEKSSDTTYIAFKEFTDLDILSSDIYDSEVIDLKFNQDLKNISFTEIAEGETAVNIIDSNGKSGILRVKVTPDEDGILFSEYNIEACK